MKNDFDRTKYLERIRHIRRDFYEDNAVHHLAESLGIPLKTWENYEQGVTIPDTILLKFLCLTRAAPQWLLTGDGRQYLAKPRPEKRLGRIEEH